MNDRFTRRLENLVFGVITALILVLQFAPDLVYASRTMLLPAAVDHPAAPPVREPVDWPAELGATDPNYRVAVYVLKSVRYRDLDEHHALAVETATVNSDWTFFSMLTDAAAALPDWSNNTIRVRFEIHEITSTVEMVATNDDKKLPLRWADPISVAAAAGKIPTSVDMVLVLFPDAYGRSNVGGLAALRSIDGVVRPFLAVAPTRPNDQQRPGEAIVHEFCHGLESIAKAAGTPRPGLHDNALYGFVSDHGSYAAWYTFYLTHPTEAAARTWLISPVATPTP